MVLSGNTTDLTVLQRDMARQWYVDQSVIPFSQRAGLAFEFQGDNARISVSLLMQEDVPYNTCHQSNIFGIVWAAEFATGFA